MTVPINISARFDELDKAALVEISNRLKRSQSEVLRGLVRETLKVLQEQESGLKAEKPARAYSRNQIKLKK